MIENATSRAHIDVHMTMRVARCTATESTTMDRGSGHNQKPPVRDKDQVTNKVTGPHLQKGALRSEGEEANKQLVWIKGELSVRKVYMGTLGPCILRIHVPHLVLELECARTKEPTKHGT